MLKSASKKRTNFFNTSASTPELSQHVSALKTRSKTNKDLDDIKLGDEFSKASKATQFALNI